MKVKAHNTWLSVGVLTLLAAASASRADDSNPYAAPLPGQPEVRVQPPDASWVQLPQAAALDRANAVLSRGFGPHGPNGPGAVIRKAAEAVRDAKDSQDKEAAQKKLIDALNKCYDEDMVQREKELKQIEERLGKLRELLERRRAKKQDIIDLQLKVALNEAEGLGFYDGDRPGKAAGGGFSLDVRSPFAPRVAPAAVAPPATRKEQPK